MAIKTVSIGTATDIYRFDDADTEYGIETDAKIKVGTAPTVNDEVVRFQDIPAPGDGVSATAVIADHAVVRGDGGVKKVQDSEIIIDDAGLIYFNAGAGLRIGNCYGHNIAFVQAGAVQNTWYTIIDAGMVSGVLRDVTHDGNGQLTVLQPGLWMISYTLTFESSTANEHLEAAIEITGAANPVGMTLYETKFAGQEGHVGNSGPIVLADNATIDIAIRTVDPAPAPTLTVRCLSITAILVGGS